MKSSATFNPVLSALFSSFMATDAGFVGKRLAPVFTTPEQAANYYVFNTSNLASNPTLTARAPGTKYQRTTLQISGDLYSCVNRGIEIPVDDEERKKYAAAFSADQAAIRRIRNVVMTNHEIRVRDKFIGAGSPISSATPSTKWDQSAANPLDDVDAAKLAIFKASGMNPNVFVMPYSVFLKVRKLPAVLDAFKYSAGGIISAAQLSEYFGVPVVIAGGLDNTAADGQTVSPDEIWADNCALAVVTPGQDASLPNAMRTFVWTATTGSDGMTIETYRDDSVSSDIHRGKAHTDEKITGATLAYAFKDVLT